MSWMKLFRLYTEATNITFIKALLNSHNLPSYTLFFGHGGFEGEEEKALVIEIITKDSPEMRDHIQHISQAILEVNKQEEVLITTDDIKVLSVRKEK